MLKIRTLQISDFDRFQELINQFPDLKKLTNHKAFALLQFYIPHNLRILPSIHIATDQKNILGFIILESLSKANNAWEIKQIFIQDEQRNQDLGEELLKYVLSVYGSYGIEFFLGEVNSQNYNAISLFHKCGFRRYAKVCMYSKEITEVLNNDASALTDDFTLRAQDKNDLNDIVKLDLSCIPPDLRPAIGRSKHYFQAKKNAFVIIDNSRNLIVGWFNIEESEKNIFSLELLISPGWTYLYGDTINTVISSCRENNNHSFLLSIRAIDYNTELTELLSKSGFLASEVKELLVRTIWQKTKVKQKELAKIIFPSTQPVRGS